VRYTNFLKAKIEYLLKQLFMMLVFVLSLVDLFSNPLLEVSYSYQFRISHFIRMLYHCYSQFSSSFTEALSRLNAVTNIQMHNILIM